MHLVDRIRTKVLDDWALHLDALTWNRYRQVEPFLIRGPIDSLNIGTGGGVETVRLIRRGNHVTTIEISNETASKTRARVVRAGFGERHEGLVGHVMSVDLKRKFHPILIGEVLEHISDDKGTLARIADWLLPGGRLVLTTPTASFGQLPGDTQSLVEDGGHVRVGYDGPELDQMLLDVGLKPIRRVFNSNAIVAYNHVLERALRRYAPIRPVGIGFSIMSRLTMPIADLVSLRDTDQITIAVKI